MVMNENEGTQCDGTLKETGSGGSDDFLFYQLIEPENICGRSQRGILG